MLSHTEHLSISSASCHHPECNSCKITESWKLQPVVSSPLENVATPLYHKLSVALNFLHMSLSHSLGQRSVSHTNNFISCTGPAPSSTQPTCIALSVPTPDPQCGYPQLAWVNLLSIDSDVYTIV